MSWGEFLGELTEDEVQSILIRSTAPRLIWEAHGAPRSDVCEEHDGTCWLCAGPMARGQPVRKWAGASFTGQTRVRSGLSSHVCEPCVFVCSRLSPVMGRPAKPGKKLGGNFRNYSHLYEAGICCGNASKGDKDAIRMFLGREHAAEWFAAIADSGQKHVIPWTPVNTRGRAGRVLFDEQEVRVPDDQSLVSDLSQLLTLGATKAEIESGEYSARAYELCGNALHAFEARRYAERRSAWFTLALWLAQRDEGEVAARLAAEKEKRRERARKKTRARSDRRAAPCTARDVSEERPREREEALGDHADQATECSSHDVESRGAGDGDGKAPRRPRARQGRLPGVE